MYLDIRGLQDLEVKGRRVLVRVDFNVPMSDGEVADDNRIQAALPTLKELLANEAAVILASHLGRPKGEPDPALSLKPVAKHLQTLLGRDVKFADDSVGSEARRLAGELEPGEILMLENTRFCPGEKQNDDDYADGLAALADCFVNDAFGTMHRAHASTVGVARRLKSAAGRLVEKELAALGRLANNPVLPYIVLIGGAKVEDKLPAIGALASRADRVLVGGATANTFLAAQGHDLGDSLVEESCFETARELLEEHQQAIMLPVDLVVATDPGDSRSLEPVPVDAVPRNSQIVDIGPKTVAAFKRRIGGAATAFWSGPPGRFETEPWATGTFVLARAFAASNAQVCAGGGETIAAIKAAGAADGIEHLSTGGGASLAFVAGQPLPGLSALVPP